MTKDPRAYLAHILERANRIEAYVGHAAFLTDHKTQDAVIRNFEGIGEAAKRVPPEFRAEHPSIPWQLMAAFRDVLMRGMAGAVVWGARGDVPVPADYDGDGRAEVAVYRPASGTWYVRDLGTWVWGVATDNPVPADYDGDGAAEIAVWRPSTGGWYVRGVGAWVFGTAGDVPVPLDLDADGRVELVVYRPATGTWHSRNLVTVEQTTVAWGAAGDVPAVMRPTVMLRTVMGDVDGDGKADPSIFRLATRTWWLTQSGTGTVQGVTWGTVTDARVPGDYDGDGRMDVAVWQPSTGQWLVAKSSTGYTTPLVVPWGSDAVGDVPVRGDFDGDARTDIGVWRATTGYWYILKFPRPASRACGSASGGPWGTGR